MTDPSAVTSEADDPVPFGVDSPNDVPFSGTVGEPSAAEPAEGDGVTGPAASVEELIGALEKTTAERDEYLDVLRRSQADFENYRKRSIKQVDEAGERGAESLVDKLLPVLDACDGAISHGAVDVEPIYASLLGTLEKEGLGRVAPTGEPFDPNLHEAVLHEPADDGQDGTVVSEVLRPGYTWKGRVVRPAMVKVRG